VLAETSHQLQVTRQARADYVRKKLKQLYPHPEPPLYHINDFTLLVAVLLSAQMTDAGVNKATPALFKKAPSPEKMAALTLDEILGFVKTVNFAPTKAKNIKKLSQLLLERHQGVVPRTFEELEGLPGVGHKTASVVMTQCFGLPAFPVDTHIHRLAKRWKLSLGKDVDQVEKDLKKLFPESSWHDVHLQIIFYGREHCTARSCDGHTCLICKELNG
jgi:endonuclease-3